MTATWISLFRWAEPNGGYFGRSSFWTPDRDYARHFATWAAKAAPWRRQLTLWSIEKDTSDPTVVLDLRPPGAPGAGARARGVHAGWGCGRAAGGRFRQRPGCG
jgi:hypothetical protein